VSVEALFFNQSAMDVFLGLFSHISSGYVHLHFGLVDHRDSMKRPVQGNHYPYAIHSFFAG